MNRFRRKARRKNRGILPDNEALLDRFRHSPRCSWCGTPTPEGCQPHHLFGRGMGGWSRMDHPWNLISLCLPCHMSHHDGNRPLTLDLVAVVAARESTTQSELRDFINTLKWSK
jgi:hypothetical protein